MTYFSSRFAKRTGFLLLGTFVVGAVLTASGFFSARRASADEPLPTSIDLQESTNTLVYGTPLVLTATFSADQVTGQVEFFDNDGHLEYVAIAPAGKAIVNIVPNTGDHCFKVEYVGDAVYGSSTSNTVCASVSKATLDVTAKPAERTYGTENSTTWDYDMTGFVHGDTSAVVAGQPAFFTTATAKSAVGAYPLSVRQGDLESVNYNYSFHAGTLTVTTAPLTITPDNLEKAQGDPNPSLTGVVTGSVNGDTLTPTYATTATQSSPVGGYDITVASIDDPDHVLSNYQVTENKGVLTVTAATYLTLSAMGAPSTYGQSIHFTAAVNVGAGIATDATGTVDFYEGTAKFFSAPVLAGVANAYIQTLGVGTHAIYGVYSGDARHHGSTSAGSLSIPVSKATLSVKANDAGRAYGESNPTSFPVTITGFVNGETESVLSGQASAASSCDSTADVGACSIVVTQGTLESPNYAFAFENGTLTITPKLLVPTVTVDDKMYDGTTTAVAHVSVTPLFNDQVSVATAFSAQFSAPDVGNSIVVAVTGISLTGTSMGNYAVAPAASATGKILPYALTAVAQVPERMYDGTTVATVNITSLSAALNGDQITALGATATYDTKDVGNGKTVNVSSVSLGGVHASDYTVAPFTTTGDIGPRPLGYTGLVGIDKVYDGTLDAQVTFVDNSLGTDDASLTYTATYDNKNVGGGKYVHVTFTGVTGADAADYSLSVTGTNTVASIMPRTLHITATVDPKVYDGMVAVSVHLSDDRVEGDSLIVYFATARYADPSVGTNKPVSVTGIRVGGTDKDNYTFNQTVNTTGDIIAAALPAHATVTPKVYDGTTSANATVALDTPLEGVEVGGSTAAFDTKNVGNDKTVAVSSVTLSGPNAGNYSVLPFTTTGDITPRAISITNAAGQNKVYDGTLAATVTFTTDAIATDDVTAAYTATFADANVGTAKPITIHVTGLTGSDAANYAFSAATITSASANITPRPLHVTATAADKVFDTTTSATVHLTGDALAGDSVTLTAAAATFADAAVGAEKQVTVTGIALSGNGNYALANDTATATASITRTPVTIALSSNLNPSTIGDTVRLSVALSPDTLSTMLSLKDGATEIATIAIVNGRGSVSLSSLAVGTHALTASFAGDANYASSVSAVVSQEVHAQQNQNPDNGSRGSSGGGSAQTSGSRRGVGMGLGTTPVSGPVPVSFPVTKQQDALTPAQRTFLCTAKKKLPADAKVSFLRSLFAALARRIHLTPDVVQRFMNDPNICK